MRRSPSVHNALVLNLRSGDTNLDVCGRSPPLVLSPSLCFIAPLSLPFYPSSSHLYSPLAAHHYYYTYLSPLCNFSLDLVSSCVYALSLSFHLLSRLLRKLPTLLPLDWRFVTRNHTRWIIATSRRQGVRRGFHVGDGIVSYIGTTKTTTSATRQWWRRADEGVLYTRENYGPGGGWRLHQS